MLRLYQINTAALVNFLKIFYLFIVISKNQFRKIQKDFILQNSIEMFSFCTILINLQLILCCPPVVRNSTIFKRNPTKEWKVRNDKRTHSYNCISNAIIPVFSSILYSFSGHSLRPSHWCDLKMHWTLNICSHSNGKCNESMTLILFCYFVKT